jgi:hypothetical protein
MVGRALNEGFVGQGNMMGRFAVLIGPLLLLLLLGSCAAADSTAKDIGSFPEGETTFQNLGGPDDPRIVEIYCCSSHDGRLVILFEKGKAGVDGGITGTLSVVYEHTLASGHQILSLHEDLTEFVDQGEVHTGVEPTFPGTYRVTVEFFRNSRRFAIAKYLQVK